MYELCPEVGRKFSLSVMGILLSSELNTWSFCFLKSQLGQSVLFDIFCTDTLLENF